VSEIRRVLDRLGVAATRTRVIPENHGPVGAANWHVWPQAGERSVLRRYFAGATLEDLQYEHTILTHLSRQGWCVSEPLAPPIEEGGRWYCLTRYVPGRSRRQETAPQCRQRGADLARLHVALRPLAERIGQRPRWRQLDDGLPIMTPTNWRAGLNELSTSHPALAEWAAVAATSTADELAALGATDLPLTVIHGDFMADQNVHYDRTRFVGVIDFGVAHLGIRPYELISARSYRAPELRSAYVDELRRLGWPLSNLEEAALVPVYRAFRLGMVAWHLDAGTRTGCFDTAAIKTQLSQTGVEPSGTVRAIMNRTSEASHTPALQRHVGPSGCAERSHAGARDHSS
jgi:aminoglycoside phosphotransferase (APT) family kinase protein